MGNSSLLKTYFLCCFLLIDRLTTKMSDWKSYETRASCLICGDGWALFQEFLKFWELRISWLFKRISSQRNGSFISLKEYLWSSKNLFWTFTYGALRIFDTTYFFRDTIKDGNEASEPNHAKTMFFIRYHLYEKLKIEYLKIKDPQIL